MLTPVTCVVKPASVQSMVVSLNSVHTSFLTITLHSNNARIPKRGSVYAAGFDLFSAEDIQIKSMDNALISTDISICLPPGTYGCIAARSGLALHNKIIVGGGVIDSDYTGIIKVILFNLGTCIHTIKKGERIAQLICEKIEYPHLVINPSTTSNCITSRGDAGFGSTGNL